MDVNQFTYDPFCDLIVTLPCYKKTVNVALWVATILWGCYGCDFARLVISSSAHV